jgi:hypothetical protein
LLRNKAFYRLLIPPDEKGTEFICKSGNSNSKANFEPQK